MAVTTCSICNHVTLRDNGVCINPECATHQKVHARPVIMRWFKYDHLPEKLQWMSKLFHDLAYVLQEEFIGNWENPEFLMALRKLLEAKDCAVRAALYRPEIVPKPEVV